MKKAITEGIGASPAGVERPENQGPPARPAAAVREETGPQVSTPVGDAPVTGLEIGARRWASASARTGRWWTIQIELDLPFPPPELSPNARVHWRLRAAKAAEYRETCGWIAKEAVQRVGQMPPPVTATVTFLVPDRRRRDDDNLLSSLKSGWDGLVDAGLLRDDSSGMLTVKLGGVLPARPPTVKVILQA